jgi:hypothetical protein
VIQSIAADKPFDQFIQEQLAADQLDTRSDVATLAGLGFITVGWRKDSRLDDDTLDNALDTIGRGLLGCRSPALAATTTNSSRSRRGTTTACFRS